MLYSNAGARYLQDMAAQKAKAGAEKRTRQNRVVKTTAKYEPPRLTKFDKLEKLIVCGE